MVSLDELLRGADGAGARGSRSRSTTATPTTTPTRCRCLAARGMTATFFLTAGFLERDQGVMAHLSRDLGHARRELAPLSWEQVAGDAQRRG